MDLGLTHRLYFRILLVFCLLIASMLLFSGCDPMSNKYPYDKAMEWVCTNPYFAVEYLTTDDGRVVDHSASIQWNDSLLTVEVNLGSSHFWVSPTTSNHYDDRLLSGKWRYRGKNLVLSIEEDFIFDNQYSEIIFSPVSAEK